MALILLLSLAALGAVGFLVESVHVPVEARWPGRTTQTAGEASTLRIATFNIRHGRNPDGHVDLEPIAQFAVSHAIDILFLNEVDAFWGRSGSVDQTAQLSRLTGIPGYFYAPTFKITPWRGEQAPAYGNALLSKVPWTRAEAQPLPRLGALEPRNVVVAAYWLPRGSQLLILGTHLSTDRAERAVQIEFLAETFNPAEGPMLLIGDLNSGPDNEDIQLLLTAGWIDVWTLLHDEAFAPGLTYPSDAPRHRIDYILASPHLVPALKAIEVVRVQISDHFPVIVDIDLDRLS